MIPDIIAKDPDWPYSRAKTSVLLAAAAVIREAGPRAATLKNISAVAGITEPAIFRHFEGINGLFKGLFSVYERIFARLAGIYDRPDEGIDRFLAAMDAALDILESSRDFAYIVIQADQVFRSYPELRSRIAELKALDEGNALRCIREARDRGEIRADVDPASVAALFMGSIYFSVIRWIESGFDFDLHTFCGSRMEDFRRLITPPRPS